MKEKFLELVKEVKTTGIVAILSNTSNVKEFKDAWQKFAEENPELLKKALEWGTEFKNTEPGYLFEDGEAIENSMEIVVAIRIAGNEISECDIFTTYGDLVNALSDIETSFADAVADCVDCNYIHKIKVEEIFTAIEENADLNGEAEPGDDDYDDEEPKSK